MTPEEVKAYVAGGNASVWPERVRKSHPVLTGLFLELTRQFYANQQNLFDGVVRYDPTGKCTNSLYVESSNVWNPDSVDRRPAIIVDVGDLQYSSLSGMGGKYGYDLEEGEALYCREVSSSLVLAHLSSIKGEATNYAANTSDLFDGFADVIKNDFCFDKFDLSSILRPRLRKESPKDWECLVQFTFKFKESFATKHESQKLKQVTMQVVSNLTQQLNMVQ
jgi:hypothetical protein